MTDELIILLRCIGWSFLLAMLYFHFNRVDVGERVTTPPPNDDDDED